MNYDYELIFFRPMGVKTWQGKDFARITIEPKAIVLVKRSKCLVSEISSKGFGVFDYA